MYQEAAAYIKAQCSHTPTIALILGSGLGGIAEAMTDTVTIPFAEIPHFPRSTVHQGNLVLGHFAGKYLVCMQGRVHFYEGYSMQTLAIPVQTLAKLGAETLLLTNAAGGINPSYTPGEIVAVSDHIKFDLDSPLRGENPSEFGERFFDMTQAYDPALRRIAKDAARELALNLPEGVYAYMGGPQFETPAEIRMLRMLGADLVGMSTVPEAITAAHCGMRTLALSCVTNMAAGMENGGLNKSVIAEAEVRGRENMKQLLRKVVEAL